MLFNSFEFALFLPLVFFLYWYLLGKNRVAQNVLIVLASYVFYGWWDVRFLSLIFISTCADYWIGIRLSESDNSRTKRNYLYLSLLINLGILGYFKYYNFFLDNFVALMQSFGITANISSLNVLLQLAISGRLQWLHVLHR